MALSIGTLVGYLQLDDTNFERKAQAADRKISAMQLHLQALARENPQIAVEVNTQTEALDVLRAKLEELQAQAKTGADVRVETVQALIGIDRVSEKLRALHREAIRPAEVEVETAAANAKLDKTIAKASLLRRVLGGGMLGGALKFVGGGLLAGILPAAVPLAGAGLGFGAFGALGAAAVAKTNKDNKAANALDAKAVTLGLQATAAAQAGDLKKSAELRLEAAQLEKQAQSMLSKPQQAFEASRARLSDAFEKLIADPALLAPITAFFNLAAKDLPLLTPLIHAVSKALVGMLKGIGNHPGEVKKFIAWIVAQLPVAGRLAKDAAPLLGNLVKGLVSAAPAAVKILGAVLTLLGKLGPAILPVALGLAGLFLGPEVAAGALVVGILIALYAHSKKLRTELGKLGDWFSRTGHTVAKNLQPAIDALKSSWKHDLLPALRDAKPILKDIAKHAGDIASKFYDIISKLVGDSSPGLIRLIGKLAAVFGGVLLTDIDLLLTSLNNTLTVIDKVISALSKIHPAGKSGPSLLGGIVGGPVGSILGGLFGGNAAGTNNWRGGLTRLAENGPELVYGPTVANLAPHSKVIPAGRTMSMLKDDRTSQRGVGGMTITGGVTINHPFDGRDVERHLLRKQRSLAMGGAFS